MAALFKDAALRTVRFLHDSTAERCCTEGSEMMCMLAPWNDAVLRAAR